MDGARIGVFGLGNILLGDDAAGPRVIEELRARYAFPDDVEVNDLGTPGLDLVPHFSGRASIIVVDAMASGGPPGTVLVLERQDILRAPPAERLSPHDPGLKESLHLLELETGETLDVCLVGVVVETTEQGAPMSDAVLAAVPAAVEAIVAELSRRGVEIMTRTDAPTDRGPWWA